MNNITKLREKIISAINSCKAYGTHDAQLIIFAYQNVLRWMADLESKCGKEYTGD